MCAQVIYCSNDLKNFGWFHNKKNDTGLAGWIVAVVGLVLFGLVLAKLNKLWGSKSEI